MPVLVPQAERSVVSVRDTVQLVQLELAVGTPDALLRARNLAAACAEQACPNMGFLQPNVTKNISLYIYEGKVKFVASSHLYQ